MLRDSGDITARGKDMVHLLTTCGMRNLYTAKLQRSKFAYADTKRTPHEQWNHARHMSKSFLGVKRNCGRAQRLQVLTVVEIAAAGPSGGDISPDIASCARPKHVSIVRLDQFARDFATQRVMCSGPSLHDVLLICVRLQEYHVAWIQPLTRLDLFVMSIRAFVESLPLGRRFGCFLLNFLQLVQALLDALVHGALVSENVKLLLLEVAHARLQLLSRRLDALGLTREDVQSVVTFGVCEGVLFPKLCQLVGRTFVEVQQEYRAGVLVDGHEATGERHGLVFAATVRPLVVFVWEAIDVDARQVF